MILGKSEVDALLQTHSPVDSCGSIPVVSSSARTCSTALLADFRMHPTYFLIELTSYNLVCTEI